MSSDASKRQVELLERALAAAEARDAEAMSEAYADDAVLEFPFAPDGFPLRIEGKASLREFFAQFPKYYRKIRFVQRQFTPLGGGRGIVAEYRGEWETKVGVPYRNRYIAMVEFQGDRIQRMREYFNPQIWLESVERSREVAAAHERR